MRRKEINVPLILKYEIVPEGIWERLFYFFHEQRFEWEIPKDIHYILSDGSEVIVEKGFICDLCSIPPFLHSFVSPYSSTVLAYILHDWMYKNNYKLDELGEQQARLFADNEMLFYANKLDKEKEKTNEFLYKNVRLFGGKIYARNIKDGKF